MSKPVHYIFVFVHKMNKQDKTFIFMKSIYEYVLINSLLNAHKC